MELHFGDLADDDADQIQIALQERIIGLSPRILLLSGDALNRIAAKARKFSGQKVAMFENLQFVDDKEEVHMFAFSLDEFGWRWLVEPNWTKNNPR